MLQQGPEVVHPSLDEPSANVTIKPFVVFEIPAQLLGFLVNQALWSWGLGWALAQHKFSFNAY